MKKLLLLCTIILGFGLSACTQTTITCGEGLEMIDGICVIKEVDDPICEEGFHVSDGACVEDELVCEDGYELNAEETDCIEIVEPLVCDEGFELNETETECIEIVEPLVCDDGYTLIDGACVMDAVQTCDTTLLDYDASDYNLVWQDEFDVDGSLDPLKWDYQIGNGGAYGIPGWGNNELQYYSDSINNVSIENGILQIKATTEGYAQYGYTSGRVRTAGLGDFQYGVFEICAKMPTTLGTWPAIWMLPTDSPYGIWPNGGEIDIMEAVGFESNTIHFNIHTKNDNWGTSRSIGSSSFIPNIDSEFHAYAVKWTAEKIIFYVDGFERFSYTPQSYSYEYWPFDTEFHVIMNIAVGGSWGGIRGIEEGPWEDSMFVDYVRIYQEGE